MEEASYSSVDMGFDLFGGISAPAVHVSSKYGINYVRPVSDTCVVPKAESYSEDDDDMGYGLFDDYDAPVTTQSFSTTTVAWQESVAVTDTRADERAAPQAKASAPKKLLGGIQTATSSAELTADQRRKLAEHNFSSARDDYSFSRNEPARVKNRPSPSFSGKSSSTSVKSSRHFLDPSVGVESFGGSSPRMRSGGGVGRFKLFKKWRQMRSTGFVKEHTLANSVLTPLQQHININQLHTLQTGFGVTASLATKLIQQHNLIYLFKGPKNQNSSCWLDAALGLALTIVSRIALSTVCRKNHHRFQMDTQTVAPHQDLIPLASSNVNKTTIDETDLKFLNELFAVYCFWTHMNQTQSGYHKKMTELVNSLWKQFEPFGFRMGDPACVIASFKLILTKLEKFLNKQVWTRNYELF